MTIHNNLVYLKHILDAIDDIQASISSMSKVNFQKNKDVRDAIVRRLEIIGEAAKNVSGDLKKKYPTIEWKKVAGTRDIMIHAYFRVDFDIVWNIMKNDLPTLKENILKIKEELEKS